MSREPDIKGPCGRSWLLRSERPGGVSSWLVNRPGAHTLWQWWIVGVVHLRAVKGLPTPSKRYPEAEYEFIIFTLNPEKHPSPDPDETSGYSYLTPIDVVKQFHGLSDVDASRLCEQAVRAIMLGSLGPDQNYRLHWESWVDLTVKNLKAGQHPLH